MRKLPMILMLTVLLLFIDLYGKLLISKYVIQPLHSEQKQNMITKPKNKAEETSDYTVSRLLGSNPENLLALYGEPARMEPSAYDYEWWIYNEDVSKYIQFGILDDKIVTIYAAGEQLDLSPLHIGQKYVDIYSLSPFSYEIALESGAGTYQFELSESELNEQPLIPLESGWAQLYFDKFTQQLSGVRYMDEETLLKQQPYELIYTGELIHAAPLTEEVSKQVEAANERQIWDITNVIRVRHQLAPLTWDAEAAAVAYLHSKDMKEKHYFAHESPQFGTLGDRLQRSNVVFQAAGENIASNYTDGIAAMQGWLNSDGHRENLLNEQFTGLGVGVYDTLYTQNFITK